MPVEADPTLGKVLIEQKPSRAALGDALFLMLLGVPMADMKSRNLTIR